MFRSVEVKSFTCNTTTPPGSAEVTTVDPNLPPVTLEPSQSVQSRLGGSGSARSRPPRRSLVYSGPVWLITEQVVCDSRYELTSKDPERGSTRDAGREKGRKIYRSKKRNYEERGEERDGGLWDGEVRLLCERQQS